MNHATAICPCSDCTKARKWKATAYACRYRGFVVHMERLERVKGPRWVWSVGPWQNELGECVTAKSAMRAAEKYVDDIRKVKK